MQQSQENMNVLDSQATEKDIADNLANWNDRAHVHRQGGYGDLAAFIADTTSISSAVRSDYRVLRSHLVSNSVARQRLLHLQCHVGTDTLSWHRLGAIDVHGLDFSEIALNYARDMSTQAHADISYVQADARYASEALADKCGSFDVIVTSVGTITWLPELSAWATSIEQLLAPGGVFMIRDMHPLLYTLEDAGLRIVLDYFSGSEYTYESDSSYTEGSQGKIAHTTNHSWAHDFQEIIGSLLSAGLILESLEEYDINDWQAIPEMVFDDAREGWVMPQGLPRIPLSFSVVARKPRSVGRR